MKFFGIYASNTQSCYRQDVTLSGARYVLELRYNTRMGRWLLDVLTTAEQPIVQGLPLLINTNLVTQYPAQALPPGALFVLDNSGNDLQPGLPSFLQSHVLVYADPTQ